MMSCDAKSLKRFKKLHKQLHEALKSQASSNESDVDQCAKKVVRGLTVKHESQ